MRMPPVVAASSSRVARKAPATAPAWVQPRSQGSSPSSSREGALPNSRGSAQGRYLGEESNVGPGRRRSPLRRMQDSEARDGHGVHSPKVMRCDEKVIEMALEGGGELSLLSRSISSFAQFLPLPSSVKASEILSLNLHYNQGRPFNSLLLYIFAR